MFTILSRRVGRAWGQTVCARQARHLRGLLLESPIEPAPIDREGTALRPRTSACEEFRCAL
jgi:hypothetical protein